MRKSIDGARVWFCDGCNGKIDWNVGSVSIPFEGGRIDAHPKRECIEAAKAKALQTELSFEVDHA